MKWQWYVAKAVSDGTLPRPDSLPCRACGSQANSYHHSDYSEGMELVVVPVCDRCHSRVHAALIPDPGTGQNWCRICKSSLGCDHRTARLPRVPPERYSFTATVGPRVRAAMLRHAKREGLPPAVILRRLLIDHLVAVGEITQAEYVADVERDLDPMTLEPA